MNLATLLVDYDSFEFLGANVSHYELCDTCDAEGLPFEAIYRAPGDLGSITFVYTETGDTLFDGGIIWMGLGQIRHPATFLEPDTFKADEDAEVLPPDVEYFAPSGEHWVPNEERIAQINGAWDSVCQLDIVHAYAKGPYKVGVFLYAPGVGGFFPLGARWVIFLYRGG